MPVRFRATSIASSARASRPDLHKEDGIAPWLHSSNRDRYGIEGVSLPVSHAKRVTCETPISSAALRADKRAFRRYRRRADPVFSPAMRDTLANETISVKELEPGRAAAPVRYDGLVEDEAALLAYLWRWVDGLRRSGRTFDDIGAMLGMSKPTIANFYNHLQGGGPKMVDAVAKIVHSGSHDALKAEAKRSFFDETLPPKIEAMLERKALKIEPPSMREFQELNALLKAQGETVKQLSEQVYRLMDENLRLRAEVRNARTPAEKGSASHGDSAPGGADPRKALEAARVAKSLLDDVRQTTHGQQQGSRNANPAIPGPGDQQPDTNAKVRSPRVGPVADRDGRSRSKPRRRP